MNNSYPIIWVELSRKPSKYLINSIKIHNERFPNSKKYLILNKKYFKLVKNLEIEIVFIEDLPSFKDVLIFQNGQKKWNGLQKSYWTNTTARFYAINAMMKDKNISKLIHLESDCILLSQNAIYNYFESDDWGLKYAKQHKNYGCASILLVNKQSELQSFLDFINKNWHRDNFTDMNALGEFADLSSQSDFLYSGSPLQVEKKEIYDGVTVGRFFIGTDARNCRWPFSARGVVGNSNEEFDPSNYSISIGKEKVFLIQDSIKLELQNIHMHSKRIPKRWKTLERIIRKDGSHSRNFIWRLGHFDSIVFKERIFSSFQRRVLRNNKADPRFR